jgi:hypothetical protein
MALARIALTAIAALVLAACSADPHKFRITDKNKDTFMDEIKNMKGLTVEETRLLIAYQIRGGVSKALGAAAKDPAGKTIGDLIDAARKDAEAEKTEADKQTRLADDARAKQEFVSSELRKSLNLTVYSKGFQPSNASAGIYQDYITLQCAYENTSTKDIRAFKGVVLFQDLFGAPIYRVGVTISAPVKAGEQAKWSGTINFNQFIATQVQLRNTDLKDMKVVWMPASIIFADSSRVGEAE